MSKLEEYREHKATGDDTGGTQQEHDEWPYRAVELADAAIAELEATIERLGITDDEQRWLRDRCYTVHDVIQDAMDRHAKMRHELAESIKDSLAERGDE